MSVKYNNLCMCHILPLLNDDYCCFAGTIESLSMLPKVFTYANKQKHSGNTKLLNISLVETHL